MQGVTGSDERQRNRGLAGLAALLAEAETLALLPLPIRRHGRPASMDRLPTGSGEAGTPDTGTALQGGALPRPLHCDWAWRPGIWDRGGIGSSDKSAAAGWRIDAAGRALIEGVDNGAELAPGLRLFHDGGEGSCHAALAPNPGGLAANALELVTSGFGGGFVSLSITLPQPVLQGLTEDYLVAVHCAIAADMPIEAYVRLTIRHGPNETRLVRSIDPKTQIDGARHEIALDLYRSGLDPLRLTEAWCDVILNPASDGRIVLCDLAFSRRPRAPI